MNYELAKKLKAGGYPQGEGKPDQEYIWEGECTPGIEGKCYLPTLSELIEACGEKFYYLEFVIDGGIDEKERLWWATCRKELVPEAYQCGGKTPEEALANLWLAINKK